MYCKHCYKMIPDGTDICPACRKSQNERVRTIRTTNRKKRINWWLIFGVLYIFTALYYIATNVSVAIISLILSLVLLYKGMKVRKAQQDESMRSNLSIPTISETSVNKSTGGENLKASHIKAEANAIAQALHEETVRQLQREPASEESDTHADASTSSYTAKKSRAVSSSSCIAKTHKATGIQYHMDGIMKLSFENSNYDMTKNEIIDSGMTDEKIWKYEFYPVKAELIPEPDNPHDPNAVKVVVDGQHVGYIKSGSCKHILNLFAQDRIKGVSCDIGGGPYKIVEENDDGKYEMFKDSTKYFVHLTIYEKPAG